MKSSASLSALVMILISRCASWRISPLKIIPSKVLPRMKMTSTSAGLPLQVEYWSINKVRSEFIDYFEKKEHSMITSSPVVPVNDPTLLFTNAGMNQFKAIFTGTIDPSSPLSTLKRAVNSQKCIRAGGKHNDLDDVGKDTYHHTFFEMLGTWSFGNYFKKEAIEWAHDILVNKYKLPVERLYASYFAGDEAQGLPTDTEARDLWLQFLPPERVLPFDKKANFWEMGDTGPCGPCSEIHFDRIGGRDASALVNADDPDVIEIWNLVFIQFNREVSGELRPLPNKHIDTGMGLERITSILQDKRSNYDTDAFMPLFKAIQSVVGCPEYTGKLGEEDAKQNYRDMAYRVVADHIRTLSFAIADGAVPSNDGRGYVLRRILRRAVRYGIQTLGAKPGFFSKLVPALVSEMSSFYPELVKKSQLITEVITDEERAFTSLLERGVKYFTEMVPEIKASDSPVISGDRAFFLYDTLGFPVDLTQLMAAEQGLSVDIAGFQEALEVQKTRSRDAARDKKLEGRTALTFGAEQTAYLQGIGANPTDDSAKYSHEETSVVSPIKAIFTSSGFVDSLPIGSDTIGIVLESSPFYAEAGGQSADKGKLIVETSSGPVVLEVLDVQSYAGYSLHTCIAQSMSDSKSLQIGSFVKAQVDYSVRRRTVPNHTMTHVLNYALREVLGEGVDQKGSSVNEDRLRFDFSSNRGLTNDELVKVEKIVNDVIRSELDVDTLVVPLKDAMAVYGLRAVFGEVYPDPVRVVSVGQTVSDLLASPTSQTWGKYSIEFCGGTHLSNTRDAQAFSIVEETAVAKGIRRITGVTGSAAIEAVMNERQARGQIEVLQEAVNSVGKVVSELDAQVASQRSSLELLPMSTAFRSTARAQLESLQKQLAAKKNAQLMTMVDAEIELVKLKAVELKEKGVKYAVFKIAIGSDSKAIKRAIDSVKKVAPELTFMCVSAEEDKVTCFAVLSDVMQKDNKIKANEWVAKTVESCGGRGGGRDVQAQGSVADASKLDELVREAEKYLASI